MIFNALDLSNNYAGKIAALEENFVFNLCAGEGEFTDKLQFIETGKVNEIGDPIHR